MKKRTSVRGTAKTAFPCSKRRGVCPPRFRSGNSEVIPPRGPFFHEEFAPKKEERKKKNPRKIRRVEINFSSWPLGRPEEADKPVFWFGRSFRKLRVWCVRACGKFGTLERGESVHGVVPSLAVAPTTSRCDGPGDDPALGQSCRFQHGRQPSNRSI